MVKGWRNLVLLLAFFAAFTGLVYAGSIYLASCGCGYKSEKLFVGRGRAVKEDNRPVLCRRCQQVRTADMLQKPVKCNACGSTKVASYEDDSRLYKKTGDREEIFLGQDHFLCPRCRKFNLRFNLTGKWD